MTQAEKLLSIFKDPRIKTMTWLDCDQEISLENFTRDLMEFIGPNKLDQFAKEFGYAEIWERLNN